jgi:hypothetical protein
MMGARITRKTGRIRAAVTIPPIIILSGLVNYIVESWIINMQKSNSTIEELFKLISL